MSAAANARPDAPRNERATGKTQQLTGKTEKNAENTETPFATELRETLILQKWLEANYFVDASSSFTFVSNSALFS